MSKRNTYEPEITNALKRHIHSLKYKLEVLETALTQIEKNPDSHYIIQAYHLIETDLPLPPPETIEEARERVGSRGPEIM